VINRFAQSNGSYHGAALKTLPAGEAFLPRGHERDAPFVLPQATSERSGRFERVERGREGLAHSGALPFIHLVYHIYQPAWQFTLRR
jgi:hypothetical protein